MQVELDDVRFLGEEVSREMARFVAKVEAGTVTATDIALFKGHIGVVNQSLNAWEEKEADERAECREAAAYHWAELPYTAGDL